MLKFPSYVAVVLASLCRSALLGLAVDRVALKLLRRFNAALIVALGLSISTFCLAASAAEQSITVLMPAPPQLPAFAP